MMLMLGVHMGHSDKVVLSISCERTFLGVHLRIPFPTLYFAQISEK